MIDRMISRMLDTLRQKRPLVHNITNFVVMNFTANALLSLGASPVMAHAPEEVEEMAALAGALVINIGTLSIPWVDSMFLAARAAEKRSIPIVLDPVGAGATRFRTETARRLLDELPITVVRGNASEILALAGETTGTRGVDAVHGTEAARSVASKLAEKSNTVVAVTGVEDFVTDGLRGYIISNGHALMSRVTGTGCAASAITGAFCAVEPDALMAVTGALVTFGLAGERAARSNPRPGTFQTLLLDALDEMDGTILQEGVRIRIA
ncbi:hydroxyethylthiazole kinase [Desulforhabdus sp. TSK]|uniref:hydroxyethylthiazole kinase n=1 Tax=Desulforhabdus sp. TSK TaxID=2925014 RepID=UPI001FC87AD7|nr:hydroxyethylthiazole kinase [Desulforhabdus sp. TSK]GKT06847.1 hydroxyethylthiazole kinase [Desulforhabdus sp. TSK]